MLSCGIPIGSNYVAIHPKDVPSGTRSTTGEERAASADSESAQSFPLVFASHAGGLDQARGFATHLAGIRIFDELK